MHKKNSKLQLLIHPRNLLTILLNKSSKLWTNDRTFLKVKFYLRTGHILHFNNPQTFNEKLQWLKVNDRHPEYSKLVDKIEVKDYVSHKIGEEHIIKTLCVWQCPEEINFDVLPNQFVLKCSHDSGGVVICKDKTTLNKEIAIEKLKRDFKKNYYSQNREYPYASLTPRILAEQYMVDESGFELKDYKIFCFNGEPKFFKIDFGRYTEHHANYYDLEWNLLPFDETWYPRVENANIRKPENFQIMIDYARKLSEGMRFVRVDLYNVNGRIYFGELTFFPTSGMTPFEPEEWDYKIGNYLNLKD